ncbi:MAG: homocysteine S-methyltransferase family protein [Ignavibacteria bacterium]|nr:homocysteine S-methyltransferase family protein [Ignavibacteria bacterium]
MQLDRNLLLQLKKPLVLDGPMGTLLIDRGVDLGSKLWSALALLNAPDKVLEIHKDYISSGADIITTNTFRTNPYAIKLSGVNVNSKELVKIAVNLAKKSISTTNKKVLIAGSNAPADDCYLTQRLISESELYNNHSEHIQNLIENKVDFILNETFGDAKEIEIVCRICLEMKFPFAVSVLINSELKTFFNQDLIKTFELIEKHNPLFVSLNCSRPELILKALDVLQDFGPFGVYPNLGSIESFSTGKLVRDFRSDELKIFVEELIKRNVKVIGVCCGGNPKDIKLIRKIVDEL